MAKRRVALEKEYGHGVRVRYRAKDRSWVVEQDGQELTTSRFFDSADAYAEQTAKQARQPRGLPF